MRLYFKFVAMHLKRSMAYRRSFFFYIAGQFLLSFTSFLSVWFLLERFEHVQGYTLGECLLCSGVMLMSFALAECFFRGFDRADVLFRTGEFDRLLVRPRGLMFQVLCQMIDFSRIGKLLQALLMLGYGIAVAPVGWTAARAGVLVLMVIGGTAVFGALFILYAAISIFTMEGLEVMNVFTYGMKEFGAYPLDVFGREMLKFCTFLVPYALFQYYPLLYLLGRTDNALAGLLPLMTAPFVLLSCALWRFGVSRYKSAGS